MDDDPKDPNDMRRIIREAAYGNRRVDGKPLGPLGISYSAPMIVNCYCAADYRGLSGEDKYTMLAYHALIAYEKLSDIVRDYVNSDPSQPLIIRETKP